MSASARVRKAKARSCCGAVAGELSRRRVVLGEDGPTARSVASALVQVQRDPESRPTPFILRTSEVLG
jgi:hypothetical protein